MQRVPLLELAEAGAPLGLSDPLPRASVSTDLVPRINTEVRKCTECRLCRVKYANPSDQRDHLRSAGHVARLRRWLAALSPDRLGGSGSGEHERGPTGAAALHTPLVALAGPTPAAPRYMAWRCVVEALAQGGDAQRALGRLRAAQDAPWAVLLYSAGRFAGALFERGQMTSHKTLKKYTMRRKQGGSQSSRDNRGGSAPQSAGASLRRANEKRLAEMVREQIARWSAELSRAIVVLFAAPKVERSGPVLFFEGGPVSKGEARVVRVPFTTYRPSLEEARRVYAIASSAARAPESTEQLVQALEDEAASLGDAQSDVEDDDDDDHSEPELSDDSAEEAEPASDVEEQQQQAPEEPAQGPLPEECEQDDTDSKTDDAAEAEAGAGPDDGAAQQDKKKRKRKKKKAKTPTASAPQGAPTQTAQGQQQPMPPVTPKPQQPAPAGGAKPAPAPTPRAPAKAKAPSRAAQLKAAAKEVPKLKPTGPPAYVPAGCVCCKVCYTVLSRSDAFSRCGVDYCSMECVKAHLAATDKA
eukprot:m51a1_g3312 hypothetical protein (528) ;mRNA; f:337417-339080